MVSLHTTGLFMGHIRSGGADGTNPPSGGADTVHEVRCRFILRKGLCTGGAAREDHNVRLAWLDQHQ